MNNQRFRAIEFCDDPQCRCEDRDGVVLYDGPSREEAEAHRELSRYDGFFVEEITRPVSTHTPGPWELSRAGDTGDFVIISECQYDPIVVATVHELTGEHDIGDLAANATMIAAAPEMLAALERLRRASPYHIDTESCECGNGLDDSGNVCEHIQANRAIAKAKGKLLNY